MGRRPGFQPGGDRLHHSVLELERPDLWNRYSTGQAREMDEELGLAPSSALRFRMSAMV